MAQDNSLGSKYIAEVIEHGHGPLGIENSAHKDSEDMAELSKDLESHLGQNEEDNGDSGIRGSQAGGFKESYRPHQGILLILYATEIH